MNVHSLYYRPYRVMLLFAMIYKVSNGQKVIGCYMTNFLIFIRNECSFSGWEYGIFNHHAVVCGRLRHSFAHTLLQQQKGQQWLIDCVKEVSNSLSQAQFSSKTVPKMRRREELWKGMTSLTRNGKRPPEYGLITRLNWDSILLIAPVKSRLASIIAARDPLFQNASNQ